MNGCPDHRRIQVLTIGGVCRRAAHNNFFITGAMYCFVNREAHVPNNIIDGPPALLPFLEGSIWNCLSFQTRE